jgi:hypothetical protein
MDIVHRESGINASLDSIDFGVVRFIRSHPDSLPSHLAPHKHEASLSESHHQNQNLSRNNSNRKCKINVMGCQIGFGITTKGQSHAPIVRREIPQSFSPPILKLNGPWELILG